MKSFSTHSHSRTTTSPLFGTRGGSLLTRLKCLFLKTFRPTTCAQNPPLLKPFRLAVAQWSDIGHRRTQNEDSAAYVVPKNTRDFIRKGALLVVADGMGGHASGEVASQMAVEAVRKTYY